MAEFTRPFLYAKQLDAMFCTERYGIIEASTKSGKTVSAIAWLVEAAMTGAPGRNYWWAAPGYNQAEIAYRRIKNGLTRGSFVAFDTPTPKIRLLGDTWIWFKSTDNSDALYGEDVWAAVIDEASRVQEPSWHAIRSTLTATRGPIRIIGNVKGRKNWFFTLARRAEAQMLSQPDPKLRNMHYSRITADDAVAGGVLDAEEIEDARATLPDAIFRELYYAEPGDDTGNPFGLKHIEACAMDGLAPGPVVAWGVDLAKSQDYLVCIGLNDSGAVAAFKRWRGVPWRKSIQAIWQIVGEDTPTLVDSTGVGDPVLEELQHEHGNFYGYRFTATSKQKLMEGLSVSIQSHEMRFPKGFITQELDVFEYAFTRTGVQYSAPEGHHDDCVCALALARQMWAEVAPGVNVAKFYQNVAKQAEAQTTSNEPDLASRALLENLAKDVGSATVTLPIDNELESLYYDAAEKVSPESKRLCAGCGLPVIGSTRNTDGEYFWHIGCGGHAAAARKLLLAS